MSPFTSKYFWRATIITLLCTSAFFAWEIGVLRNFVPSLSRPPATTSEYVFAIILALLLSINVGLLYYGTHTGTCPMGAKKITSIASILGVTALICPACLVLPLALVGISTFIAILSPFLPLLKILSIFLVATSTLLLWPKKR